MAKRFPRLLVFLLGTALLVLAGCDRSPPGAGPAPPKVTVTPVVEREVLESVEFQGHTEAVEAVEVRARVTGYLVKINFKPNTEVKAGDVLFEIDPKIYQAEYDRADGQVAVVEAKLKRLNGDVERNAPLVARGTVAKEDFEKMRGDRDEAIASLKAAKATREGAKVNLDFTQVKAPISGKIGRNLITVGNLVKSDSTLLANIVSTKQIYAYFDVDENAYLRYQEQVRQGKVKPGEGREGFAEMTLGDGAVVKGGTIDNVDVQLSRGTGTIEVRAAFPDPDGLVKAGQFVRVRLPVGDPQAALVVPEVAIGSDQGLTYVYVVDDHNKVEYRRVVTGSVHNGLITVNRWDEKTKTGLKPGELVIVKGLLRVRDGVTVEPERGGDDGKSDGK